jgi:hypothetical protein
VKAGAVARVERAVVVREAWELVAFRGTVMAEDTDLVSGLTEEYRRTLVLVRHFHRVVEALEDDTAAGPQGSRKLAVEWELYQAERKHLASLAVAMGRLGLEEKRLALDEGAAVEVADLLGAAFDALELTPEQQAVALRAMVAKRADLAR